MTNSPGVGTERRAIEVPGLDHGTQPFPIACRRGPLIATSGIFGREPVSGELPAEPGDQIRQAFANLDAVLQAAGATMDHVVQVLITLADLADRTLVNDVWTSWFPDPSSRPSRNTTTRELPGGARITLLAMAWADQ